VAVQIICSPPRSVSFGQLSSLVNGSVSWMLSMVRLPALVTTMLYSIGVLVLNAAAVADFTTVSLETGGMSVTAVSSAEIAPTSAACPVAVAVLVTEPAATSASFNWYETVHRADKPGRIMAVSHVGGPVSGSSTDTLLMVTLPVLVTTIE